MSKFCKTAGECVDLLHEALHDTRPDESFGFTFKVTDYRMVQYTLWWCGSGIVVNSRGLIPEHVRKDVDLWKRNVAYEWHKLQMQLHNLGEREEKPETFVVI